MDIELDDFDFTNLKEIKDKDIEIENKNNVIRCLYSYYDCNFDKYSRKLLAEIDSAQKIVTIYPFNTFAKSSNFLHPKYDSIEKIIFKGYDVAIEESDDGKFRVLKGLPRPFLSTLVQGLGFRKEYHVIARKILEEHRNCKELIITKKGTSKIDNVSITISDTDLDAIRRGLDRIVDKGRNEISFDKSLFVYSEILHKLSPNEYPEKKVPLKKDVIYRTLKHVDFEKSNISLADKNGLLAIKDNVDLGYITTLAKEFGNLINNNLKEKDYQNFLQENPVLLTMFSGSPYIQFKSQAYVGGKTFDDTNGKYPDFLLKHKFINNTFIVEIKTPSTKLLENTPYRGIDVFSPSKDLSSAIAQFLAQKYELETSIATLKHHEDDNNIDAYNVQGLIIIGNSKCLIKKSQKRSFELHRNNQKNVRIITYDECLEQLNTFIELLSQKTSPLPEDEDN